MEGARRPVNLTQEGSHRIAAEDLRALRRARNGEKKCIKKVIFVRISIAFARTAGTGGMGSCAVSTAPMSRAADAPGAAARSIFILEDLCDRTCLIVRSVLLIGSLSK